jgi:hypothetical protein
MHNYTTYTTINWDKRKIENDNFAYYQINLPLFKLNCLQEVIKLNFYLFFRII